VKAAAVSSRVPEAAKAAQELPPPGKRVADFATDISVDTSQGQLVVVPPVVATAATAVVPRAKGSALSAGGEMPALTAVRDEAGAVSRRLKEMKEALSQVR
jgi:hypothetical protein